MDCLLAGYVESLEGNRGWGGTPPAQDLVSFLNSGLTDDELKCVLAAHRPLLNLERVDAPCSAGTPMPLHSPLASPPLESAAICDMLGTALREGIRWNQSKLEVAFQQAYGAAPPQESQLFD